ncbi:MAG: hypothetical protein HRU34_14850 [Richelia sp.]|nr:hypothetical protein [Richelia sp.]
MNSNPTKTEPTDSANCIILPKIDACNITFITPKIPKKPILPWTHFDLPWLEEKEDEEEIQVSVEQEAETEENQSDASTIPSNITETSSLEPEVILNPSQQLENQLSSGTIPETHIAHG